MVATYFVPWLEEQSGGIARHRRVIKIAGLSESGAEEKLKPYYAAHPGEPLTILASMSAIELHLTSTRLDAIAARERELIEIFGKNVYGFDDDTLEGTIGKMLIERDETVSTAESCTGGLLAQRITDISGSSRYFMGGVVAYTGEAKTDLAYVDRDLIQAVALCEVSECGVARHDLSPFAIRETDAVRAVERPQGGEQRPCVHRSGERAADPADDSLEQDRIEPHVRIGAETAFLADGRVERKSLQYVHLGPARVGNRSGDGRLEAVAEVQDEVRALDPRNRPRRQLEVVRLRARRSQVLDLRGRRDESPRMRPRASRFESASARGKRRRLRDPHR